MGKPLAFGSKKALQQATRDGVTCKVCDAGMTVCDRGGDAPCLRYTVVCSSCKRWFDAGSRTVLIGKKKEEMEVPPFGRM